MEVPIVTLILSEGGSGGALALGMGNKIAMMSNAYYAVISPEGAASILGKYDYFIFFGFSNLQGYFLFTVPLMFTNSFFHKFFISLLPILFYLEQGTRMKKLFCSNHDEDYIVRTSKANIKRGMPICYCGEVFELDEQILTVKAA